MTLLEAALSLLSVVFASSQTDLCQPKALIAAEVYRVVITSSVYVKRMGNQVEANIWTVDLHG